MASIQKKLNQWLEAGLIDAQQLEQITSYENTHTSAWSWLHTFMTLGAAIMGLGVISLIAANWEYISPSYKLIANFSALAALALLIFTVHHKNNQSGWLDVLITGFIILCLASIGLVAQIYHLGGYWYHALLFWGAITLPLILFARHLMPSFLWVALAIPGLLMTGYTATYNEHDFFSENLFYLPLAALMLLIILHRLAALTQITRALQTSLFFWLQVTALYTLLFADALHSIDEFIPDTSFHLALYGLSMIAALALMSHQGYKLFNRIIAFSLIALLVVYYHPTLFFAGETYFHYWGSQSQEGSIWQADDVRAAVLTLTILFLYALHAANRGYQTTFNIVTFLIGLRFVVLYFQAFGGLLATGIGLIISGAVIISITWLWHKNRKHLQRWAKEL